MGVVASRSPRAAADDEAACLVALAQIDGVGPICLTGCLDLGAVEAWQALVSGAIDRCEPLARRIRPDDRAAASSAARRIDPLAELERCRDAGIRVRVRGRRGYPTRLLDDLEPPAVLFTTGPVPEPSIPTVAIVGTRNATTLGRTFARRLGADLTSAGVCVVAGLALGIDGAAHRGALRSEAPRSVAVIASGLDVVYPRRHAHLHAELASRGLLVSETPAGIRPDAWRFPARNRIIAGLADSVVVVESRVAGGSLHTVDEALARDVPVLAVPGHPSAPASAGTNALIYDGAGLVRDTADVLLAIGVTPPPVPRRQDPGPALPDLGPAERAVLDALGSTPSSLAELVAATGRTVGEVSHALARLAAANHVREAQGWYEAVGARTAAR